MLQIKFRQNLSFELLFYFLTKKKQKKKKRQEYSTTERPEYSTTERTERMKPLLFNNAQQKLNVGIIFINEVQ